MLGKLRARVEFACTGAQVRVFRFLRQHQVPAAVMTYLAALAFCVLIEPPLQKIIAAESVAARTIIADLKALLLAVGAALVGAAAIILSLIMFAMQVSVERTPVGLFHAFSSDRKLILAFGAIFTSALTICSLSLFATADSLAAVLLGACYLTCSIFYLLLYGYQRSLYLINPQNQIELVEINSRNTAQLWDRRFAQLSLLAPLIQTSAEPADNFDYERAAQIRRLPNWSSPIKRGLEYLIQMAHQYAENGDYVVSARATGAVVKLTEDYITTKGRSFFPSNPFIDDIDVEDPFINDLLELLRKAFERSIRLRNEDFAEQLLTTLGKLSALFLKIDYSARYAEKHHSNLTAGYLCSQAREVSRQAMPDVTLHALATMSWLARLLLEKDQKTPYILLIETITLIGALASTNEELRALGTAASRELGKNTLAFFMTRQLDDFIADTLVKNLSTLTVATLTIQETKVIKTHDHLLGPYFSTTDPTSFLFAFSKFCNVLLELQERDANNDRFYFSIASWADDASRTHHEIFQLSSTKRSSLVFHFIGWTAHVSMILFALSLSVACPDQSRESLRKSSQRLLLSLTFFPNDPRAIQYIGTYSFVQTLERIGVQGSTFELDDFVSTIISILCKWAFHSTHQLLDSQFAAEALLSCCSLIANSRHEAFLSSGFDKQLAKELDQTSHEIIALMMADLSRNLESIRGPSSRMSAPNEKTAQLFSKIIDHFNFAIKLKTISAGN